ncbi:MAG: MdtA/MuxA family multidrug efflux RND transporter periplasmic adaptor subunit [Burkholderia sp.]
MNNQESQTPRSPAPPPQDPVPYKRRRPIVIGVAALVVIGGVLLWWHPWKKNEAPANGQQAGLGGGHRHGGPTTDFANQPQPVEVATASRDEMPIVLSALGTVTPLATVTVKTQLSGYLQSVNFTEGQMVKKGDLLVQIDPRPYQIALETAEGTLARDQALLATARLDLKRYQTLLAQDSISGQQADTQASLVKQYEGTVKTDQASIDLAKLNLTYARVTAPVSGRVGLRQVDAGNYVTPSDTTGLVLITQLQPMSVIFTTSEDNMPPILKQIGAGQSLSVTAYNRSNTVPLEAGSLETFDNQIDTTTGTIKLRATFANKNNLLFPNQFVNTRLLVDTLKDAVIVPTAAVQTGSIGQFVYIVKPDNTVTVRKVKPGPVDGERTSIADGVQVGERVVTDGVDRLREGAKITIPAEHSNGTSGASSAHTAASGASGAHGHRPHRASQSTAQ